MEGWKERERRKKEGREKKNDKGILKKIASSEASGPLIRDL